MDPLSVTASIIGILTAAQKVSSYIGVIVPKYNKAAEEMLELKTTVDTTHAVLSRLQAILLGQAMRDPTRPSLILVDQVVVILTACVKIFSDLNTLMQALDSNVKIAILDRVRWATKTDQVKEYLHKLEMQKNSLMLILTIFTCESTFEAKSAAGRLEDLVTLVLESHEATAQHLLMPGNFSTFTSATTRDASPSLSEGSGDTTIRVFGFQQDLESSRVYSRNRWLDNDTSSLGTRTNLTARWSMMSGLSLSDISNIGVLELPITIDEISNGQLYMTEDSGPSAVPPTQSMTSEPISPNARRTTFIASTEYYIGDWEIRVQLGMLGITSRLILSSFTHHNIIWVIPCFGDIEYPVDEIAEPLNVRLPGDMVWLTVQYHKCKNITYVLLDCQEFRSISKNDCSDCGLGASMSPRYCSIWNQSIAKIMQRFNFDQYFVYDLRSTLALLYVLPQTVPCCFLNHEYGPQLWQNLSWTDLCCSARDFFQLDHLTIQRYFGQQDDLDFVFMIASYLKYHQSGRGFVNVGPESTYDTNSLTHRAIQRAGLTNIIHLNFPNPSDTAPFDSSNFFRNEEQLLYDSKEFEQARPNLRVKVQEYAGLDVDPKAEIFIFAGRWTFQRGVDLIANVMPSILQKYGNTQLICIGPVTDQCGRDAVVKLTALQRGFPTRVYIKHVFTSLPPFLFTGTEFALLPVRYHSGLASIEFGRKGAIGIGSICGGQGQTPGFWYKSKGIVKADTLERLFKKAIKDALKSTLHERMLMRAGAGRARFPVPVWVEKIDELQTEFIQSHSESRSEEH